MFFFLCSWKIQLTKKQTEAGITNASNSILLQNILPFHVSEIYLNRQQLDGFYYEKYDNVAIMFATITNFNINSDTMGLNILNELICDFDEIVS